MNLQICNGVIISPGIPSRKATVRVVDGVIRSVGPVDVPREDDLVLDAAGSWVVPGFVDIHTHGAAGASAMDGTEESMRTFAEAKLREGVTSFLPTTWAASSEELLRAAESVRAYRMRMDFARVPGLHLEGPFLNPTCLGAQNPAHVRLPCLGEIERIAQEVPVSIVSLAVEMEGGLSLVKQLADRGMVPSLAHTAATYGQFLLAKQAGLRHLTHFCNQMRPLHHREIGIVGAGLLDDEIRLELIADGIHLCPDMIRLVFRTVAVGRILLITDSISASGMPDGNYRDGGQPVIVSNGICRLENGALAGSTLRFNQALRVVTEATGRPIEQVIACAGWNQAVSLGLSGIGKIEPGYLADLVVLEPDTFAVQAVVVGGEVRWTLGQ